MPMDVQRMCQTVRGAHHVADWQGFWMYILWSDALLKSFLGIDTKAMAAEWGSWASVSNVVRLLLLQRFGGVWLDCDFICHKKIEPIIEGDAGVSLQDRDRACNAFMYATPGHAWIERQLENIDRWKGHTAEWGVSNCTQAMRPDVHIVPAHLTYPYSYDSTPEKRVPHPDSFLEHTWKKNW